VQHRLIRQVCKEEPRPHPDQFSVHHGNLEGPNVPAEVLRVYQYVIDQLHDPVVCPRAFVVIKRVLAISLRKN
jgi:hypothetical protein